MSAAGPYKPMHLLNSLKVASTNSPTNADIMAAIPSIQNSKTDIISTYNILGKSNAQEFTPNVSDAQRMSSFVVYLRVTRLSRLIESLLVK